MKQHMNIEDVISRSLTPLHQDLIAEIVSDCKVQHLPGNTVILRAGQYVKVVPVVLKGLVKVFTQHEDRELLLYYIQPRESCIMSFSAGIENEKSRVFAVTEEDSLILMLPAGKVNGWTNRFPDINMLFFQQYNQRYSELLDTIHHVLFNRMDQRLYSYLKQKHTLTGMNPMKVSHRQIANELGTAREVISRVVKKLENEGKIIQHKNSIEIL